MEAAEGNHLPLPGRTLQGGITGEAPCSQSDQDSPASLELSYEHDLVLLMRWAHHCQ